MSVLLLQIFVSLCLVAGSVVLYVFTVRESTFEHADRLALAPLDDDERQVSSGAPQATPHFDPNRLPATDRPMERP